MTAATSVGDAAADAAVKAVQAGEVPVLQQLLTDHPALATARRDRHGGRTLMLVAADWPGHFPNAAATIRALVVAGADVNAPSVGKHAETPLHWAANSGDVVDAVLDVGANIDAAGGAVGTAPHCSTRPCSASGRRASGCSAGERRLAFGKRP